jgi:hypothetical protein
MIDPTFVEIVLLMIDGCENTFSLNKFDDTLFVAVVLVLDTTAAMVFVLLSCCR